MIGRRQLLWGAGTGLARPLEATPGAGLVEVLVGMLSQLGGIGRLVTNKTVAVRLNLTGPPNVRPMGGRTMLLTGYRVPRIDSGGRFRLP